MSVLRSVIFPVAGPRGVEFPTITVERQKAIDRNERFAMAPGYPDVMDLLLDARADDPPDIRLDGVSVVVSIKGFGGKSYGLALAIADQRVRRPGSPNDPVIATGCIAARGRGQISGVDAFVAKVDAIIAYADDAAEAITFVFPAVNLREADQSTREALEQAERRGSLRLVPCETLHDAQSLWRVVDPARRRRIAIGLVGVLSLAAGTGFAVSLYYGESDARECRTLATAITAQAPPQATLAKAVQYCERAVQRTPDDGRLRFLFGQFLALNGSQALAAKEWQSAAELGDSDGMAAHGRLLWQSRPGDLATVTLALDWLKRAAKSGSAAAAEDVGFILLDGTVEPQYPDEAEQWLKKARALRAQKKQE